MEQFAVGISYGMGLCSLCWVVGFVVRAVFKAMRQS